MSQFEKRQPKLMEVNIKLIVSSEKYGRMAAVNVRPSSENRAGTTKSDKMMGNVVGRAWTRVLDMGASWA